MTPLAPRDAYALWAATYDSGNPVQALDALGVGLLSPPLAGVSLLDAGCGTAHRLAFAGEHRPRRAAGVDLVLEMLAAARKDPDRPRALAQADVNALPLRSGSFGVAWCRLVAGYVDSIVSLYRELARLLEPGGVAIVTDFHPAAARAGHTRTFRDASGTVRTVASTIHEPEEHEAAARQAGLAFDARLDLAVGDEVRPFYERAGALARLEADRGLPLLLAYRFRR